MCNFPKHARDKWGWTVTILSILIAIGGLVMLILSIMYSTDTKGIFNGEVDLGELKKKADDFKNATFVVLLIFSLIALFTGIGGSMCMCKPCKEKGCCWAVVFGIPLGLTWMVFFIVGIVIAGVSYAGSDGLTRFCNSDNEIAQLDHVSTALVQLDQVATTYANHFMCSTYCNCPTASAQAWIDLGEDKLKLHQRTLT